MAEWKKRKNIEGVSSSSIVGLKAVVSSVELQTKRAKLSGSSYSKDELSKKSRDLFTGHRNKGSEERANKDEIQHLQEENAESWENIEQNLKAKSELYARMVRGEIENIDEEEKYSVDFEKKSWEKEDKVKKTSLYLSDEEEEKQKRNRSVSRSPSPERKEFIEEQQRLERQQISKELESETKLGRRKHLELKIKRKKELESRLNQIKNKGKLKTSQTQAQENQSAETNSISPQDIEQDIDQFLKSTLNDLVSKK